MSHEIKSNDKVFTLVKAWHGLETIVTKIEGFGFEVSSRPLSIITGTDSDGCPVYGDAIASHKAIVDCSGNLVSVQKSSYEIINNQQVWEAVQTAVAQIEGARVVSAGSIKGRKVIFATVELDGLSNFTAGGDSHTAKLNLISSHDGTKAFTARCGVTRIVCANTVRVSEQESAAALTLYHTKRSAVQIQGMNAAVEAIVKGSEAYKAQADSLRSENCDMLEVERFLAAFLAPAGQSELSTRTKNQIGEISALSINGKGNHGETRWDLFNGITEYFTHEASEDKEKLFESSEFGLYADKKAAALPLLLSDKKGWKNLQAKGKELLALA